MRDGRQDTGGLATALQLLGAAGVVEDDDGQAELFEAPAPLPLPVAQPEGSKGGRPKGARNRSTDEWVRYFLGRYRSPLTALAELYSRSFVEIVEQLQEQADKHKRWKPDAKLPGGGYWERVLIDPTDVLKLQRDAAVALLPYIHKRQPMALELDVKQRGIVVLGDLGVGNGMGGDDLALPLQPIEENQQVIEASPTQSDGSKSEAVATQQVSTDGI